MAYTLGNKCAKKICKPSVLVQLIIENVVTVYVYLSLFVRVTFHYNALQCTMRAGQQGTDNRH